MKFVISTQELNYLINKCQNVVAADGKSTIPILSNFLIEAKDGELILTATDLKVGVRCHTEAKIVEEGMIALPAKRFSQLIKELTSVNVEVSTNDSFQTEVIADSSRFKVPGVDPSEFPPLASTDNAVQFTVKESEFRNALYWTSFTVAKIDDRYTLTGLCMNIANGYAIFAGTDGKRLARSRLQLDIDPSFSAHYLLPLKAVDEILKNLPVDGDGELKVFLMSDKIAIETGNMKLVTKLLTGEFPDISGFIPTSVGTKLAVHRDELITLLKQVALFADKELPSVRFTFSNGELKLAANTADVGEGKVSMPVNYQGPSLDIAFNPNFFLAALQHSRRETVTMALSDPFNPGVITDQEDITEPLVETSPLFVLMPMRVNEG